MRGVDPSAFLRDAPRPLSLRQQALAGPLQVAVMAPHPDDFDAVALTLRHLQAQGHVLHLAVLTTGEGGVDDGFGGAHDAAAKAVLREAEQRASCAFFGLPPGQLQFLRLWGDAARETGDRARLRAWMDEHRADLVFMPHGNDSNRTHRRTFETVCAIAAEQQLRAWALLNQDAKTTSLRVDAYFDFDDDEARWKAHLLRLHRSQQDRNLRTRGVGFDERVLRVNGAAAQALGIGRPYAEAFELMELAP